MSKISEIWSMNNNEVNNLINNNLDNLSLKLKKLLIISLSNNEINTNLDNIYKLIEDKIKHEKILPVSEFVCNIFGKEKFNYYGLKISDALIRIAATRIFSDPEQSILELVANSVDAYNSLQGIQSIGKFGMGFMSILYWIAQEYSRYIEINTHDNGRFYSVILKWTINGLILENNNSEEVNDKGTMIKIFTNNYPFTDSQVGKMTDEVRKMFEIRTVKIICNGEIINRLEIKSEDIIEIIINNKEIIVSDSATGIPEKVLYNSLLIPSSSTKTRQIKQEKYDLKTPEIVFTTEKSSLHLIVNSVSVVNITTLSDNNKYIIYLPNDSKLPVSRDDIVYGEIESKYLKKQLWKLIKNIIAGSKNLISLFELLDKYLIINKQENLFKIIMNIKTKLLGLDVLLIPNNNFWNTFIKEFKITNYCYYNYYDKFILNEQLYKKLIKISRDDIFKMRKCVKLTLPELISTELPSFLFINDFDNITDIISSSDTLLIPINDKFEIKLVPSEIDLINKFKNNDELKETYLNLKMTIFKKFQNITYEPLYFFRIFNMFCDYCNKDEANEVIDFIYFLNSKISSIKLNFTYGVKRSINYFNFLPSYSDKYKSSDIKDYINKKVLKYIVDLWNNEAISTYWLPSYLHLINIDIPENILKEFTESVDNCITNAELFIFAYISEKIIRNNKYVKGIFDYILDEIRRKYTNSTLDSIMKNLVCHYLGSIDTFNNITDNDLLLSAEEYYKNLNSNNIYEFPIVEEKYKFTCKTLITYLYQNDIDDKDLFEKLSNYKENEIKKLQIVEIAVNEGTSKPFVQAVLTELIQNSVDAFSSKKSEGNCTIDIKSSKNMISVSDNIGISDINIIITMLVPFLSSKNPNDPNLTGEMGTGMFNIYRQPFTKRVFIITNNLQIECIPLIKNDIVYDIQYIINDITNGKIGTEIIIKLREDMPEIINDVNVYVNSKVGFSTNSITSNNNVFDDIELIKASGGTVSKNKQLFNKKQLQEKCDLLKINYKDKDTKQILIDKIVEAFGHYVPPAKNGIIYNLNGVNVNKQLISIYKIDDIGEVFYTLSKVPSLLLTNNATFCNLSDFMQDYDEIFPEFIKYSNNSIIVNLNKSIYVPNQSRSKINISNKDNILKLINNGLYFVYLYMYVKNYIPSRDTLLNFSTSRTNISHLKQSSSGPSIIYKNPENNYKIFKNYGIYNIIPNYSYNGNITLCSTINNLIDNYSEISISSNIGNYYNSYSPELKPYAIDAFNKRLIGTKYITKNEETFDACLHLSVLSIWFNGKDVSKQLAEKIVIVDKKNLSTGGGVKISNNDAKVKWDELQIFVNIYWSKIKLLPLEGVILNSNPPIILNGKSSNGSLGFYNKAEHCIVMNSNYYNMDLFKKSLQKANNILLFQTDPELYKYFASNMTTTLIHELGHAVQGTNHNESAHGTTTIKFKGDTKFLDFDDMCLEIYKKCIINRLFTEYLNKL